MQAADTISTLPWQDFVGGIVVSGFEGVIFPAVQVEIAQQMAAVTGRDTCGCPHPPAPRHAAAPDSLQCGDEPG